MFGWKKGDSGPTQEQLREAYLERLAEVLGLSYDELASSEASQQGPIEPAPDPVRAYDESFLKLVGINQDFRLPPAPRRCLGADQQEISAPKLLPLSFFSRSNEPERAADPSPSE